MAGFIDSILERPRGQKVAIWVGSLLIVALVGWFYVYSPVLEELSATQEEVDRSETKLLSEQRIVRNLPKFREEVADLEAQLAGAIKQLPDKKEIPALLDSISSLAKNSGLEVLSFKPDVEQMKDFYAEVPVDISLTGTFHQVGAFLDELGRLTRIVNASSIATWSIPFREGKVVRPATRDIGSIPVNATLRTTAFRYLDQDEIAAQQAAAAAQAESSGGKRRKPRSGGE